MRNWRLETGNYKITTKHSIFYFLILISCFLFPICPVSAEEYANITADHLEYLSQSNTYIARGSVKIVFEGASLSANEMRLNGNTNDAVAAGNVIYEDSKAIIEADRIELNIKTKLGTIYESYIYYKNQNMLLRGREINKIGEKSFFLDKATVTSCEADPPEWHISGKDITATQHKSLRGWHGSFNIKNIPVLYTPYFWAPLIRKRQTGLMFPLMGYSSERGYYYKQGFFWAINDNQDASFYLDYYGKKGFAEGFDYRYILTPETRGELWMYHARDKQPSRSLYEIKSYHNQELPYNTSGYLKVHTVNERDYYETLDSTSSNRFGLSSWETDPFGFASEERLQKYLQSNMHISKPFYSGRTYLLALARKSLEDSSSEIPQNLPELGIILNTQSLGFFSYNFSAKGVNFWKEEGQDGVRLDISPNLYFSYGRLLNITQRVGLRETAYFLNEPNEYEDRFFYDLNTTLMTRFFRKYSSFIHIIEPSLEYNYIYSVDQENIPFFDSTDLIQKTNSITYSFTNRISGFGNENLESSFRLSQSYSLLDSDEPFTPMLAEIMTSSSKWDLRLNASYDLDDNVLTEMIGSVNRKGKKGHVGIGKNLRRSTELDQYTFEIGINRPIKVINKSLPIDLNGTLWYDTKNGRIQELTVTSTYDRQCWGLSTTYKQRPDEYQVIFAVEFKGLGSVSLGSTQ
jgi:LPS-assembly protein